MRTIALRRVWSLIVALGAGAGLAGCASTPAEAPVQVRGTYVGTVRIESDSLPARLELNQRGGRLEGTLHLAKGPTAQGAGEVSGRGLTLGLAYDQGCPGQLILTGRASPDGGSIEGSMRVADCTGVLGGAFQLRRLAEARR
ncbi:MAG: hypothetical protein R3E10_02470 [Gemmatimonadota bacterium]